MGLSNDAERAIAQLIERRRLHENLSLSLPVPIAHIARTEGWDVYFRDGMTNLYGFAVVNGPVKIMTINATISGPWRRHAVAHEMGHFMNSDPGKLYLCHEWPWLRDKAERNASIVAAKILIPDAALREMGTMDAVATACGVPFELVELRISTHREQSRRLSLPIVPQWKVA